MQPDNKKKKTLSKEDDVEKLSDADNRISIEEVDQDCDEADGKKLDLGSPIGQKA